MSSIVIDRLQSITSRNAEMASTGRAGQGWVKKESNGDRETRFLMGDHVESVVGNVGWGAGRTPRG